MRGHALRMAIVAAALTAAVPAAHAEVSKEDAAVAVAEQWLAMVDGGQYADAWTAGAKYFKDAITQDQWKATLNAVRTPLGAVEARQKMGAVYQTQLPGAPDGEYVVIQYKTAFANKKEAIETVTPALDADGTWRVSGYYIR